MMLLDIFLKHLRYVFQTTASCAYNSCGNPNGYIQCSGSCSASCRTLIYNTACTLYSNSNNCEDKHRKRQNLLRPRYLHRLGAKCPPNVPGIGSPCNINACGDPSGYLLTCSSNGLSAICSIRSCSALQLRHLLLLNLSSQRLRSDHHRCGKWHDWLRQLHLHRHSLPQPLQTMAVSQLPRWSSTPAPSPPLIQTATTSTRPDTPPSRCKLNYYFEWSRDGTTWSGSAPSY